MFLLKNNMEDEVVKEHFDLLAKTRSTIEGILASGRSDIWSTYGALRRAREILYDIFVHGLFDEGEEVGHNTLIFNQPCHEVSTIIYPNSKKAFSVCFVVERRRCDFMLNSKSDPI